MNNLIFNEMHQAIRKTVREFVAKEITPYVEEWDEAGDFPSSIFARLGELGFLGIRYPEQYGGSGGDYLSSVVVAEELAKSGAAALPAAVEVHIEMATPPILKFGSEEQKQRFVVPAVKGEKIAALAITEPNAGSDVAAIETTARKEGSGWVLNGTKMFITNGCRADFVLVVAKTDREKGARGVTVFLVEKGAPGFTVGKRLSKVGFLASDTAELVFADCFVPEENVLGEVNKGFYHIMWELQGERLIAAAQAAALAEVVLQDGLQYAQDRVQFGQKLATFQALRHRFAELASRLDAAKQFTHVTAWRFNNGDYPVKEISMCKLLTSQVCFEISDFVLQVHGGYGYMKEYPAQRYWRDSRLFRIAGGTDEIMKEIISKEIMG